MAVETVVCTAIDSFVGKVLIAEDEKGLRVVRFMEGDKSCKPDSGWRFDKHLKSEAVRQLVSYFKGELREFDLPLSLDGTPFQETVWKALLKIPFGETVSYGEIARRIGRPRAVRAVGGANGKNNIPIVVPCHRIIGCSGRLTGFGSGLPIKEALLEHEWKVSRKTGARAWK
ncbi:MAG: methylated-DNA--[protein]-cysteine S-methyltransferase [Desulfobacteraceae bacterium]|nr:MAG: methylated-DNA--[protein]-cysteine S-methyltransferase [Desulfobacteraceae bacterium]